MNESILIVEEYIRQAKGVARKMFGAEGKYTNMDLWMQSVVTIATMLQQEKINEPIIVNQTQTDYEIK